MPRIPRKLSDGYVYYLLNRCHGGEVHAFARDAGNSY